MLKQHIPCHVCKTGGMNRMQVYRLSGPVVGIGYLFLLPSILGLIVCFAAAVLSVAAGTSGAASATNDQAGGVFVAGLLGAGVFGVLAIASLVSGLFGWLLTMKKHVLVCGNCRASADAL